MGRSRDGETADKLYKRALEELGKETKTWVADANDGTWKKPPDARKVASEIPITSDNREAVLSAQDAARKAASEKYGWLIKSKFFKSQGLSIGDWKKNVRVARDSVLIDCVEKVAECGLFSYPREDCTATVRSPHVHNVKFIFDFDGILTRDPETNVYHNRNGTGWLDVIFRLQNEGRIDILRKEAMTGAKTPEDSAPISKFFRTLNGYKKKHAERLREKTIDLDEMMAETNGQVANLQKIISEEVFDCSRDNFARDLVYSWECTVLENCDRERTFLWQNMMGLFQHLSYFGYNFLIATGAPEIIVSQFTGAGEEILNKLYGISKKADRKIRIDVDGSHIVPYGRVLDVYLAIGLLKGKRLGVDLHTTPYARSTFRRIFRREKIDALGTGKNSMDPDSLIHNRNPDDTTDINIFSIMLTDEPGDIPIAAKEKCPIVVMAHTREDIYPLPGKRVERKEVTENGKEREILIVHTHPGEMHAVFESLVDSPMDIMESEYFIGREGTAELLECYAELRKNGNNAAIFNKKILETIGRMIERKKKYGAVPENVRPFKYLLHYLNLRNPDFILGHPFYHLGEERVVEYRQSVLMVPKEQDREWPLYDLQGGAKPPHLRGQAPLYAEAVGEDMMGKCIAKVAGVRCARLVDEIDEGIERLDAKNQRRRVYSDVRKAYRHEIHERVSQISSKRRK